MFASAIVMFASAIVIANEKFCEGTQPQFRTCSGEDLNSHSLSKLNSNNRIRDHAILVSD